MANSNHLEDINKGSGIREPEGSKQRHTPDISNLDVHSYLFSSIIAYNNRAKQTFLDSIGDLQHLTWRDVRDSGVYIITFPYTWVARNCETEEQRRLRVMRTEAEEKNVLKRIRKGSVAFATNMRYAYTHIYTYKLILNKPYTMPTLP